MKVNKISGSSHRGLYAILALIVLTGCLIAGYLGFNQLNDIHNEPTVITDLAAQVSATDGKMIRADVITGVAGLKPGVRLSDIDLEEKRIELLDKLPALRAVTITRQTPSTLQISAEERIPVARLGISAGRDRRGRVVDTEGKVFICRRGTQTLPIIREAAAPGTQEGQFIKGRVLTALRLLEVCREREFLELNVQEIDASKTDYLTLTLGNYSRVKICWESMDNPNERSRADLTARLKNLIKNIRSNVVSGTVIWNATMPDIITADMHGTL